MRAKQRRRMEAKAAALVGTEVHEVIVDEPEVEETAASLRTKLRSLEALLKGEHLQVNRLRAQIADEKEDAAVTVAYTKQACVEEIAAAHKANEDGFVGLYGDIEGQLNVARAALAEIVDDTQARLILGSNAIFDAVVEAVALRVQTLPQGPWTPKLIAEKIRRNDFEHPSNVRDYYPVMDQNGFPVMVDGNEVEVAENVAFKEEARRITQEAKKACRELHRMKLENDRPPVTTVMGQPWYLTGTTWSK